MAVSLQPPVLITKNGQSLLEVLVALAVALLVILALVRATIVAIRNADFAKKQAQASSYAQEGMENIRAYRDASWTIFWGAADGNNHGFSGATPSSGACPSPTNPNISGTPFTRCSKLEKVDLDPDIAGVDSVKATVTVFWIDSSGTHQSQQISYFSKWK